MFPKNIKILLILATFRQKNVYRKIENIFYTYFFLFCPILGCGLRLKHEGAWAWSVTLALPRVSRSRHACQPVTGSRHMWPEEMKRLGSCQHVSPGLRPGIKWD